MFVSNNMEHTHEYDEHNIEVSNITHSLEPGIYKIRFLYGGFDLVRVGYSFISSKCVDCMGNNRTSMTQCSSSGPRLYTAASTVTSITPAISLTLVFSRSTVVYSGSTSPLDDGVFWH